MNVMNENDKPAGRGRSVRYRGRAFTLIELLTVIAIIGLLIGILLPSLQAARVQAKNVRTRGQLKAIGDALEMFRNENEGERELVKTGGYPPSQEADDPTEAASGEADERWLYGAHWLVRYLMGKDLRGFVPRRYVPRALQDPDNDDTEQLDWYLPDADGELLDRVGPYLPPESRFLVRTKDLPGAPAEEDAPPDMNQPVFVDSFGYPILYYAANAAQARRPNANMVVFNSHPDGDGHMNGMYGIYSFADNGLFTGACTAAGVCPSSYRGWDLGAGWEHKIKNFGATDPPDPQVIETEPDTFQYYILNKDAFRATAGQSDAELQNATVTPYRKDTYLLITAGRDGLYGTSDDVTNF